MQGPHGRWCRVDDAGDAVDHQRHLSGSGRAGPGDWSLGRFGWPRPRHRPDRRGSAAGEVLVGLGVSRECAHRDRCTPRRLVGGTRFEEPRSCAARSERCPLVDHRSWTAAVGDHRGSDAWLDLGQRPCSRSGQHCCDRCLCRMGGTQPSPDAEAEFLSRAALLLRSSRGIPWNLRADGGAVRPNAVSPVRSRLLAAAGRDPHPPDGDLPGRQCRLVATRRPDHQREVDGDRRPRCDRRRPLADLSCVERLADLRPDRSRSVAHRRGCRSAHADRHELGRGVGPPG